MVMLATMNANARGTCPPLSRTSLKQPDIKEIQENLTKALSKAETYFESACRVSPERTSTNQVVISSLKNKPKISFLQTVIPYADEAGNLTIRHKSHQGSA